jgi:hypothetical protein
MKISNATSILFAGLAVLGAMVQRAAADESDQKTIFTFNGPIEIPGRVLPAGTYVFKLVGLYDRNTVQVFSKDETYLYGTFHTIPEERLEPAGKTIITFDERSDGSPEAVKTWFYPGDDTGHEFVYR